jgi:outer membrane protein assembly factor BamB
MSPRQRTLAAAAVLSSSALFAANTILHAADWPQWRGPNRDARAEFTTPASWPKQLNQKWKVQVGEGVATPALVGDRLYVFSRVNGDEVIRCLDAASGNEIWSDKYASQGVSGPAASFPGPRSSPAVADGKVVTLGVNGTVSCLTTDGKKLWRKDDFNGTVPQFFTSSSPLITDGMVIVQLGGGGGRGAPGVGAIVAYDLASGDQKWKAGTDSPAYGSPITMTVGEAKLVIAMTNSKLVAVTLADGKQVWETPFQAMGMGGYNACTPIVDGQTLIYSGGGRGTKAVKIEKEGDKFTGKELWSNPDKSVQFNSPVLKDGKIYGVSISNELFCIDAADGKTVWGAPIGGGGGGGGPGGGGPPPGAGGGPGGGPPGGGPGGGGGRPGGGGGGGRGRMGGGMRGGGYGSIIDAGSSLLVLSPSSELIVVQPGDKFTEQAKIKISDSPTYAYPVVSGNRLFVKDQNAVALLTTE